MLRTRSRPGHCDCHTKEVEISNEMENRKKEHKVSEEFCKEGESKIFYQLTLPGQ